MDLDKIEIIEGTRFTKIIFKIEKKKFARIIEEGLDEDLYSLPISKKDFEIRFDYQDADKQMVLFDIEDLGKEIN